MSMNFAKIPISTDAARLIPESPARHRVAAPRADPLFLALSEVFGDPSSPAKGCERVRTGVNDHMLRATWGEVFGDPVAFGDPVVTTALLGGLSRCVRVRSFRPISKGRERIRTGVKRSHVARDRGQYTELAKGWPPFLNSQIALA